MFEKVPLHSICFAMFPVLCGFAELSHYLLLDELVLPIVVSLLVALILLGISYAFLKNWRRAGIVASLTLLANFSFEAFAIPCNQLLDAMGIAHHDYFYLPPYIVIVVFMIYVLLKSKADYKIFTQVLNVIALFLIVYNTGRILYHEYQLQTVLTKVFSEQAQDISKIKLTKKENSPDIYYLILDAHARADTLRDVYDYDNSEFIKALEKRGFVVAPKSRSNYQMTCLSLPSTLNMCYLDKISEEVGKTSDEHNVLYRLIQHNSTALLLKKAGYKFVNVRSGWSGTQNIPEADTNIGFMFGNIFHIGLMRNTAFGPLQLPLDYLAWAARKVRTFAFTNGDEIINQPSPKFAFVHICAPHPPFLFKENGKGYPLDKITLSEDYTVEKYVAQVKFVQNNVLKFIDKLNQDKRKKVIIIQSDHGPSIQEGASGNPSDAYLKERMTILNAYKLPGLPSDVIYDGITPVNSFRLVLNKYFDANLKLLEDKSYFSPITQIYNFEDVTSRMVDTESDDKSTKETGESLKVDKVPASTESKGGNGS